MSETIEGFEPGSPEHDQELRRVGAIARLTFARTQHPDLLRAEAEARVQLAASIQAMDIAIIDGPGLLEQHAVNVASQSYLHALADLVRGEPGSSEGTS